MAIEKQKRLRVARQFELQAGKLGFSVVRRVNAYTYLVHDGENGGEVTACVLASSFDFYEYRLRRRSGLLVVQEHDAAVPLRVLCLHDGHLYDEGVVSEPEQREKAQRRNRSEVKLLVSKLLISDRSAWAELARLPLRTQQYYKAKMQDYLSGRVGRPWAS